MTIKTGDRMQDHKKMKNSGRVTRRGFFNRMWKYLGIAAGFEATLLFGSFLVSGEKRSKDSGLNRIKAIGRLEDIEPGTVYPFRSGQLYLVRLPDGGFLAVSLKCTHLGCSVRWIEESGLFVCPCHASQFDKTGNVLSPPAPRALDLHPVFVEKGLIKVDLGRKVKRRFFEKSQVTFI